MLRWRYSWFEKVRCKRERSEGLTCRNPGVEKDYQRRVGEKALSWGRGSVGEVKDQRWGGGRGSIKTQN